MLSSATNTQIMPRITYSHRHSFSSMPVSIEEWPRARELPDNFVPGPRDVICGRGMKARNHEGNKHFRACIEERLEEYASARNRIEKTVIVSSIIDLINQSSPTGGFVREQNGKWTLVREDIVRDKVGQRFRDLLYPNYMSSSKTKRVRRKSKELGMPSDSDKLLLSESKKWDRPTATKSPGDSLLGMFGETDFAFVGFIKNQDSQRGSGPNKSQRYSGNDPNPSSFEPIKIDPDLHLPPFERFESDSLHGCEIPNVAARHEIWSSAVFSHIS